MTMVDASANDEKVTITLSWDEAEAIRAALHRVKSPGLAVKNLRARLLTLEQVRRGVIGDEEGTKTEFFEFDEQLDRRNDF